MSILEGSTTISNFTILIAVLGFAWDRFLQRRYGLRFKSDAQMLEYILDKGIDKALLTVPKLSLLKEKIFGEKKADDKTKEETDKTPLQTLPKPKSVKTEKPFLTLSKKDTTGAVVEDDVTDEKINQIRVDSALFMSGLQMEFEHLLSKIKKAIPDLNYNNGDDGDDKAITLEDMDRVMEQVEKGEYGGTPEIILLGTVDEYEKAKEEIKEETIIDKEGEKMLPEPILTSEEIEIFKNEIAVDDPVFHEGEMVPKNEEIVKFHEGDVIVPKSFGNIEFKREFLENPISDNVKIAPSNIEEIVIPPKEELTIHTLEEVVNDIINTDSELTEYTIKLANVEEKTITPEIVLIEKDEDDDPNVLSEYEKQLLAEDD